MRKTKLTTAFYTKRFEAEMVLQQRRYCDAFKLCKAAGGNRVCATALAAAIKAPVWRAPFIPCRANCKCGRDKISWRRCLRISAAPNARRGCACRAIFTMVPPTAT